MRRGNALQVKSFNSKQSSVIFRFSSDLEVEPITGSAHENELVITNIRVSTYYHYNHQEILLASKDQVDSYMTPVLQHTSNVAGGVIYR